MSIHSTDTASVVVDQRTALRSMTTEQLRYFGAQRMVYVRCGTRDGEPVFALFGADGTRLSVVDSLDAAVALAVDNSLEFITVH
jgi:hypothetical protein